MLVPPPGQGRPDRMDRAFSLTHVTAYRYDRPIRLGPQVIRLYPAPHARARILGHALRVEPAEAWLGRERNPQGGLQARATFPDLVEALLVEVRLRLVLSPANPFDFVLAEGAERWPFGYEPLLAAELAPNLAEPDPLGGEWRPPPGETVPTLIGLARRVAERVAYERREEEGVLSPAETLARGRGSCRDTGWLLVHALRGMGIAARFCSGYLVEPAEAGPGGTAELHAWAEAYLPGAGWVGFDPTSGLLAAERHLPLASAAHPSLAAPVSGTHEPCEVAFSAELRLEEEAAA